MTFPTTKAKYITTEYSENREGFEKIKSPTILENMGKRKKF